MSEHACQGVVVLEDMAREMSALHADLLELQRGLRGDLDHLLAEGALLGLGGRPSPPPARPLRHLFHLVLQMLDTLGDAIHLLQALQERIGRWLRFAHQAAEGHTGGLSGG